MWDDYWDVDFISDTRIENGTRQFRVRWVGYKAEHDTWQTLEDLGPNAKEEALELLAQREETDNELPSAAQDADAHTEGDSSTSDDSDGHADNDQGGEATAPVTTEREKRLEARQQRLAQAGSAVTTVAPTCGSASQCSPPARQ